LGFGPRLFGIKPKETEYIICAIPLGGYVKLAGDNRDEFKNQPYEYLARRPFERAKIIFFGPVLNYLLGFLCFWMVNFIGYPTLTSKVGGLVDGFPAKAAGIMPGDRIISVDGNKVRYWEELQNTIHKRKEGSLDISVLRGGEVIEINVIIRREKIDSILGEKQTVGLIGIKPDLEDTILVRHNIFEAFVLGAKKVLDLTCLTYKAIWRIVRGYLSFRESVTGPLGIFYITKTAAKLGLSALLHLVAVLNVSLAIFNLLPLPLLDGGHLLFLGIEKLRGRVLSQRVEEIINRVGISLLILLAVFVFYNDLIKFGIIDKFTNFYLKK
jgi:regulator of sigma E protease